MYSRQSCIFKTLCMTLNFELIFYRLKFLCNTRAERHVNTMHPEWHLHKQSVKADKERGNCVQSYQQHLSPEKDFNLLRRFSQKFYA